MDEFRIKSFRHPIPENAKNLENLASRFYSPLSRYFHRREKQRSTVQDLVQEVFLRLSKRSGVSEFSNAEAYLMKTAESVWNDHLRHQYAREHLNHVVYEETIHAQEDASAERIYAGRAILEKLLYALDLVPKRQRQVFVLCRLEGMSQPQVAARLQVSLSSVEKDLVKVLSHLTEYLKMDNS